MEQKSSTIRFIGKCKITLDELDQLTTELGFNTAARPLKLDRVDIETENSTYKCNDVKELRNNRSWKRDMKKFSLWFEEVNGKSRSSSRTVIIKGGEGRDNLVFVSGDEEGWVIGTADVVSDHMKSYQVWYSPLVMGDFLRLVYGLIIFVLLFPALAYLPAMYFNHSKITDVLVIVSVIVSASIASWTIGKISTKSTIIDQKSEPVDLYKFGMLALTLILTILTLIILVLTVFYPNAQEHFLSISPW